MAQRRPTLARVVLPRPPTPPRPRIADSPAFTAAGSVWALLFGMGMLLLGNGLQSSLLGVRAAAEDFGATVTGLVMAGYFVGFLGGSRMAPYTINRVGHLRVFAAIASLASIAILVQSVFVMPAVWAIMRVVTGYCLASAYIVAESWLNDRVTNEHRGGLLAIYMIVSYLGMGGGQLLLNAGEPTGYVPFLLVSVLISFAAIPILLSITPQPLQQGQEALGLMELYRISPLGVVGSFGSGLLQGAVFGMGAVYARTVGLSIGQTALFMFVLVAGPALLQWPIGKLSDRVDRRRVITGLALFGTLVSLGAIPSPAGGPAILTALAILLGAGPMLLHSLFLAYTNDYLRLEQMVAASSALILAFGLGAILGPPSVGLLMEGLGPAGFPVVLAGAQAAIVGFAVYRMRRRGDRGFDTQSAYATSPASTATLAPALVERAAEPPSKTPTEAAADHPAERDGDADGESGQRKAGAVPTGPPPDDGRTTPPDDRM